MIISRTPLRIGLFGGGTDLFAFSKKEFGCVINASIDKYVYLISHKSFDNKYKISYSKIEHTSNVDDIEHERVREAIKRFNLKNAIEVHSIGEVPAGTGLGSSSSFTVGLLNLLHSSQGKYLGKHQLAEEASDIEINVLKEPIGKQDHFAAAYGGMNFMKFNLDGSVEVEPIRATAETLKKINESLVVFYLDKKRDASSVLSEQSKNVATESEKFETMQKMKQLTIEMKEDLNNNKIDRMGEMLHKSWLLKRSLTSNMSDPEIDKIYDRGLKSGAEGGKILGAGGGGFIMFYCKPEKQSALREELRGLREFDFNFESAGSNIIYYQQ